MGGVTLLYQGAGWLEGGLTASFEKLILDAEILQMMAEVLSRSVSTRHARARRDGRGRARRALLRTAHTMARYETAFYRPLLSDGATSRRGRRTGATATERANGSGSSSWPSRPPPLDPAVAEALDAFVAPQPGDRDRPMN